MTGRELTEILFRLRPGAAFAVRGSTLADVEWQDKVLVKPTHAEVEAFVAEYGDLSYIAKRQRAYPALNELAEAVVAKEKGDLSVMAAYVAKCDAVKEAFPKKGGG